MMEFSPAGQEAPAAVLTYSICRIHLTRFSKRESLCTWWEGTKTRSVSVSGKWLMSSFGQKADSFLFPFVLNLWS